MTRLSDTAARRGVQHRLSTIGKAIVNDITGYGGRYHRQVSKAELLATLVDVAEDYALPVNGGREVVARCPNTLLSDEVDGRLCIQRRIDHAGLQQNWFCRETVVVFRDGIAELASRSEWCVGAKTAAAFDHTTSL